MNKPKITTQDTMEAVNDARAVQAHTQRLSQFAIPLGCVLRDKFDFSNDKQFDDWAAMAWKAAEAFLAKEKTLVDPANDALMKAVDAHNALVNIEADKAKTDSPTIPPEPAGGEK